MRLATLKDALLQERREGDLAGAWIPRGIPQFAISPRFDPMSDSFHATTIVSVRRDGAS